MTKRAEDAARRLRERALWPLRAIREVIRYPGRGGCWAVLECDHKVALSPDEPCDVVTKCRACHLRSLPVNARLPQADHGLRK